MSRRKLEVLGFSSDSIDYEDAAQVHELIDWLEDHHIRHYKPEHRSALRAVDLDIWQPAMEKVGSYLAELGCLLKLGETPLKEIIDWLLDYAIALQYASNKEAHNLTSKSLAEMREERYHRQKASDPLSNLDFQSEAAKKGIESLRSVLGIATYPDPDVLLNASCKFIVVNLTDDAIDESNKANKAGAPQAMTMQLSRFDLGMLSSKDGGVDAAVRALRLNHLENLREVQTEINEAIVAVQELTADPKTDKRLGKVGF
ncbi:unnamed protein product [Anisakis simplex]|uniref:UPF0568 protein C14orf166 (inferred by orthology to a human protein) n=1 Tax=Anisakis simplex TaxID=6269 RepID=A0A0M3IY15_ANISI|nr:unnamed protein product [Anisakis simplex]